MRQASIGFGILCDPLERYVPLDRALASSLSWWGIPQVQNHDPLCSAIMLWRET
jgi:hypothetical protein